MCHCQMYQWRNGRQGVWVGPGHAGWYGREENMIPRMYWGHVCHPVVLGFFVIFPFQYHRCAKGCLRQNPYRISADRQSRTLCLHYRPGTVNTNSATKKPTKFVVSYFFRQSKFQFMRSNKAAFCEPMSFWSQGYSPREESI
jgi:hypothetical protein